MRIKLGHPLSIKEIAVAIGARYIGEDNNIYYISTDTRELNPGDAFVALKGESFDGELFVKDAKKIGAYSISCGGNATIKVDDTSGILLRLAKYYRKNYIKTKHCIGITGSVGKTTTKEFLKILCESECKVHANQGNYNNKLGLPATILSTPKDTEILIAELGMNNPGEISELSQALLPDIGIITKIGTAHIGNLGSRAAIAKAKLEILDGLNSGNLIVPYGEPLLKNTDWKTFSVYDKRADCYLSAGEENIIYKRGKYYSKINFSPRGEHNLECLCAAICCEDLLEISKQGIINAISLITDVNTRQSVVNACKRNILDDSYNASLESIISDIEMLKGIKEYERKSILIGTVHELGSFAGSMHFEIGRIVASSFPSSLFFFGEWAEAMRLGAISASFPEERIYVNSNSCDPDKTAKDIIEHTNENELILFKASNKTNLSRIISVLKNLGDNQ